MSCFKLTQQRYGSLVEGESVFMEGGEPSLEVECDEEFPDRSLSLFDDGFSFSAIGGRFNGEDSEGDNFGARLVRACVCADKSS